MTNMTFREVIASAIESADLDVEAAKIDFALALGRLLEHSGISKADLAKRLGVSKPMVTRILRGDSNLTIETMVRAARAAHGCLHLHVAPEGQSVRWLEIFRSHVPRSNGPRYQEQAVGTHLWHNAANDHEAQSLAA